MNIETLLLHGADSIEAPGIVPPLELSTTFLREGDGSYPSGFSYARRGSPLRQQLEATLAQLEGGFRAFAFSSGMAAISSLLQILSPNDEILIPEDCYYATRAYLETVLSRWHIRMQMVDMTNLGTLNDAISKSTKMVWVETPSNPMLKITDLNGVAALCRARGLISVCDSTVAGPVVQQPLSFGFDYVVHSLTKSLNGHSDVLGGVKTRHWRNT
jgi:cystathionine gamma-synthase